MYVRREFQRVLRYVIVMIVASWACLTPSASAEPGVCALNDEQDPNQAALWETITSEVNFQQALFITSLAVVNDRTRTYDACDTSTQGKGTAGGRWTFGYIMRKLAGSQNVSTFVKNWVNTWATDTTVNGFAVPKRANVAAILNTWPKLSDGSLDVDKAPFRLTAIVNRLDLASFSSTCTNSYGCSGQSSGEGRLVFNYYDPSACSSLKSFNVIFEFKLPAKFSSNVATNTKSWASYWNTLSAFPSMTSDYLVALQGITDSFISASNLGQVRTNEFLNSPWELREFKLSSTTNGTLKLMSTALTPDDTLNNSGTLVSFINDNVAGILEGTVSPNAAWFGGRSSGNNTPAGAWLATRSADLTAPDALEARHVFALSTCNGCHTTESGTCFQHVMARKPTLASNISNFLKGAEIGTFDFHNPSEPVTQAVISFNELDCRALDLYDLLHGTVNGGLNTTGGRQAGTESSEPGRISNGSMLIHRVPRSTVH